jgi:hypothetical protein
VASSPVDRLIDGALHQASGTGAMDLKLALNIPLEDTDKTTVKGQLALSGNDVRMAPDMPLLAGTRAQIQFSDRSFSLASGSARVLGGEASLTGSLQPDGSLRFQSQGVATAEGLRQAPEFGPVSRLAQRLSGQAPYKLDLTVRRGQTEMLLTSPLTGLASELPAPLGKTAEPPCRCATRRGWPSRWPASPSATPCAWSWATWRWPSTSAISRARRPRCSRGRWPSGRHCPRPPRARCRPRCSWAMWTWTPGMPWAPGWDWAAACRPTAAACPICPPNSRSRPIP